MGWLKPGSLADRPHSALFWAWRRIVAQAAIRSSAILGPSISARPEELGHAEPSQVWSVIVSDHQPARLQSVCRVISDCGAVARPFDGLFRLSGLRATQDCSLAVVALESM